MKTKDLTTFQVSILKEFGNHVNKISRLEIACVFLLVVSILLGIWGLWKQITIGHGVTGMRDNIVWGHYISSFIYFIGVSYGGAILAAALYYFKIEWGKPIIRIATLMAFITGIIGPVFILLCIGRFDRLHYLFIYARVQSPITWDVMVISTYLVGITLFLYLLLIKDFSILSTTDVIKKPNWKQKIYQFLTIGYSGNDKQEALIDKSTRSVAFVIIPKVTLAFAVLSWIFGMTLRPGWHSTIFGPTFVISSIATSLALIIILMWFYRKWYGLKEFITDRQFEYLGYIMLFLIVIYGYFTFSEYITVWYSSGEWETAGMQKLFNLDEFGWAFHLSNFFGIVFPILIIGVRKLRTPNAITAMSLLLVVAIWVRRYLTVVPTLENTLLPMQETRPEYAEYTATMVEWFLVFAGASTFILFAILIPKIINIIPISSYKFKT